ncbi:hypothetical protein BD410DRAFT_783271 [Rickenella mellea]|uniref:F-box domain-containing protein n=1 Tax=Rickenella mellea TaxID=50990 RepID=A0A4Y7QIK4_9AGAM|nr:hypothetical protein BD410DRAFT_783271 [Rickenella mellea]
MGLLDLPTELAVQIFGLLDVNDLISSRLICRSTNAIYNGSSLLQYLFSLRVAGFIDHGGHMNVRHKLHLLRTQEERWRNLDLSNKVTVETQHTPSNIYDLSGGVYVLGDSERDIIRRRTLSLRYLDLHEASLKSGLVTEAWPQLSFGAKIIDIGLALEEHDLVAVISRKKRGSSSRIDLLLRNFSTGKNHASAAQPDIFVNEYHGMQSPRFSIMIEIVGTYLLLLVTIPSHISSMDTLFLYNWMTGGLHYREEAPPGTWSGFVFLSPECVVIPNMTTNTLDIYHIDSAGDFEWIRRLALPYLVTNATILHVACRADPNPWGRDSKGYQNRHGHGRAQPPFGSDPENAVVLFKLHTRRFIEAMATPFTFIVHRSALLRFACMRNLAYPDEPDLEDEGVIVEWEDWGPANTRWGGLEEERSRWITCTAGQRQVLLKGNKIVVRDYNPFEVRRVLATHGTAGSPGGVEYDEIQAVEGSLTIRNGQRTVTVVTGPSICEGGVVLENNVESSLPYVEITAEDEVDYEGMLVNDERLIGLCVNPQFEQTFTTVERLDIFSLSSFGLDIVST